MMKPNSIEKMPGKDPANEQQRTAYLDYLLKEKAKAEVLRVESENKCQKLQAELHDEEIILRTRTKTVVQFAEEQERITNFVIDIPSEPVAEPAPEPEAILEPAAEPEVIKELIEIDPDTIPEAQKAEFFKWLKTIEK